MELRADDVLQRDQEILTSDIDRETIALAIEQGKYYSFNSIGSEILASLVNPTKFSTLLENLSAKYKISKEQCQTDVMPFVLQLLKKELIKILNEEKT